MWSSFDPLQALSCLLQIPPSNHGKKTESWHKIPYPLVNTLCQLENPHHSIGKSFNSGCSLEAFLRELGVFQSLEASVEAQMFQANSWAINAGINGTNYEIQTRGWSLVDHPPRAVGHHSMTSWEEWESNGIGWLQPPIFPSCVLQMQLSIGGPIQLYSAFQLMFILPKQWPTPMEPSTLPQIC